MHRAFIIDPEIRSLNYLKKLLLPHESEVQLIGEFDMGKTAIPQIEELRPELLFLEIYLPDMSAFDLLEELTYQPLVIFTTGMETEALKAFETYAIDYLLKPVCPEGMKKAIEKLKKFGTANNPADSTEMEKLRTQQVQNTLSGTLPLKLDDRIILLDHEEITYLKADDRSTYVYLKNGEQHLSPQSLVKLGSALPAIFIRVHRSYIINKKHIREVRNFSENMLILTMKDKDRTEITTSRRRSIVVREALGL